MIWKSFRTSQLEYIITLGCLLIAVHNGLAAPVYDSTEIDTVDSNSCYYNYNHYYEGDRILTNEPCLNCTCHNRMLMCYLRVCPFTKPIGQDCVVERREDQCCPIITCPEVPVEINHHTTHDPITAVGGLEKYGCSIEGEFYPEGAQVPSNPRKPCELCYCIRNMTACVMQECTLHVDGCQPIYNKGVCCPVRYNCEHDQDSGILMIDDETTTTERPTPGFMLPTTTLMPGAITECIHDTDLYSDGEMINMEDPCQYCYCMKGDIVCAVQECGTPLENKGKNCKAEPPKPGQCCPDKYVCDKPENATMLEPMDYATEKTEITTFKPTEQDTDDSRPTTLVPGLMTTDSGVDEEATPREDIEVPSRVGDDEKDQDTKLRLTTADGMFEEEPSGTTPISYDGEHELDVATTVQADDQVELTTQAVKEELFDADDDTKTPVPSTGDDTVIPTEKVMPLDSVEPMDSTTVKHSEISSTDDVTTEVTDRFEPAEGTTQKSYDVPTPDLADHELQQHIDDDDLVITKKPQQADDDDTLIELTTHLYTDIGTTVRPHTLGEEDKMDSEEDNTVKPYDSTTIDSKDKYPIGEVTTPASDAIPTTQSVDEEIVTDSKAPSHEGGEPPSVDVTTQQAPLGDDHTLKTGKPQIAPLSTLKPTIDESESSTPALVISTENKTFKMEDAMPTEKYDELFASFVPGEGSCLLNGVTYANNSIMPPFDVCQLSCTCINSNIICDNSRCDTSPQQGVLCDTADGKCGEDLVTSTEGSAQAPVDDGDSLPPQEGSAQGEIPCAGDECDGSELIKPAQGEIACADGKCTDESSTLAQESGTSSVGSEATTPGQGKISCTDGDCEDAAPVTPASDSETPAPGVTPEILTPVRIDVSETATPAQGEIICADGKCDESELATLAPGFIPESSTPTQDEVTCTDGKCDESELATPAPGVAPELSTGELACADGKCDISELATKPPGVVPESSTDEISCTDGKCDESGLPTSAPGTVPETSTPVQGEKACAEGKCDDSELGTPAPGIVPEVTAGGEACADGKCDGSELATPVPGFVPESSTPVQGEIACADGKCDEQELATTAPAAAPELPAGEVPCADGKCDESEFTTPPQGIVPESSTPVQGEIACADGKCDEQELATTAPAAAPELPASEVPCADGKCDESELTTLAQGIVPELSTQETETPAPGVISEITIPVRSDTSESETPAPSELTCIDGKCDESETTPAEGPISESATPVQPGITCIDGKCDLSETATPPQVIESAEVVTPAQVDGSSSPTKTPQGVESESATLAPGEILCADGKCETPEAETSTPEHVTQDQRDELEASTPTKVEGPESQTPAQIDVSEISTPGQSDEKPESETAIPDQDKPEVSCADGKCDESETATPAPGDVSEIAIPAKGDESTTQADVKIACADGKCDDQYESTPQGELCVDGKCDEVSEPAVPVQSKPESSTPPQDGIECADGKCDESGTVLPGQTDIACADGKCDQEEIIQPPIKVTPQECEGSSDGICGLIPQVVPTQKSPIDDDEQSTAATVLKPDDDITCADGKCDDDKDLLQGVPDQTPAEDGDLIISTQSTPSQDDRCTSKACLDALAERLNKTSEPVHTIDIVTVLPEFETTVKSDVSGSTEGTPDQENPTESGQDEDHTDKETIITRIQILPTTTESSSDEDKITDVDKSEPTEQSGRPTEQSVIDKDSTESPKPLPIDESEIGHKTDVSKPSSEAPAVEKPADQEPIESSTMSDQDVSEIITSAPMDEVPKVEAKPTETLPTEDQDKISEPDTTGKPIDSTSSVASETPILDITSKPSVSEGDEQTQDVTTASLPKEPTKETLTPAEPVPSEDDLEEPAATTVRPIVDDVGSDKTDSPIVQVDVQTTQAPIEKVPDATGAIDDHDTTTVGSIDETPTVSDVTLEVTQRPSDVKLVPSPGITSSPDRVQTTEDGGVTAKPSETKETTSVKYTDLDNVIETGLPEKEGPKDEVTETSTPLEEVPHPTVIAPVHGEEPQNQMGVTDHYDEPQTIGPISTSTKSQTDKSEIEPEVIPTTIAESDYSASITDAPSRIDSTDKEIVQTTAATPEKPIDSGITPQVTDEGVTSKPISVEDGDKPEVTTTSIEAEPTKGATEKISPLDVTDKDVTDKPSSIAETTPGKDATDKPSTDTDETTTDQDATGKPSFIGETTPSQEATDKPSPIDITPSEEDVARPSPTEVGETTPGHVATDKPSSIDEITPSEVSTDRPSSTEDDKVIPSEDKTDKPGPSDETAPSIDVTEGPSQVAVDDTTQGEDGTDKPISIGETTPSKDTTEIPSPVDADQTTASQYVTDKPSPVDGEETSTDAAEHVTKPSHVEDIETTPSKEATDKPSPLDDTETTPTQDNTYKITEIDDGEKESEIITVGPIDDATSQSYPVDSDQTTPSKHTTGETSPVEGDDKAPEIVTDGSIDDATVKPSPVDLETTPSQATDIPSPTDFEETTGSEGVKDTPTRIGSGTTPSEDATDEPSPIESGETTSGQDATDKPQPIETDGVTPSEDSEIITVGPISDATSKPSTVGGETTPSQDTTVKLRPSEVDQTTPSEDSEIITAGPVVDVTHKPRPIDGETTPSQDTTEKLRPSEVDQTTTSEDSETITAGPVLDVTHKPSTVDSDETTPSKDTTEQPSPIEGGDKKPEIVTAGVIDDATVKPIPVDYETTPSQVATDKPSAIDSEDTTVSQGVTDTPTRIGSGEPTQGEGATDKPSPIESGETTPGQDATDKPQPIETDGVTPSEDSEIITVGPISDATPKPSTVDGETTTSQDITVKLRPSEVGETTPSEDTEIITAGPAVDVTHKPRPIDGETTSSEAATDKPRPIDEVTSSEDLEIVTAGPTVDATHKPSPIDEETTTSQYSTDKPRPIDDDETTSSKDSEIITVGPIVDATHKPSSADEKITPSEGATDQPSPIYHSPTTPSQIDTDKTTAFEEKEPEIITAEPINEGTGQPISMDVGETTPSHESTDKPSPVDDGYTTPSKGTIEKLGPIDDEDKEPEIVTAEPVKPSETIGGETTPSQEATDKPSHEDKEEPISSTEEKEPEIITAGPVDDGAIGTSKPLEEGETPSSHEATETPIKDITTTSSKQDTVLLEDSDKDAATEIPGPVDDSDIDATTSSQVTPSKATPDISATTLPSEDVDQEITKPAEPSPIEGETTPSKEAAEVTSKPAFDLDDSDKEIPATTTSAESMPTKDVTEKPSPIDDTDKESVTIKTIQSATDEEIQHHTDKLGEIPTTSITPSDSKTPSSIDGQQPTDKPSQTDDMDIITEATSVPSKAPQDLTGKPDLIDDSDKEVAGTTPGQDREDSTDKPSLHETPVTIKTIQTTASKDEEITVTDVPSRLADSDSNITTTQQTTPDEALVDELFTKPTEEIKKPQHGYEYQKPPQDQIDYTKQPTETTPKPEIPSYTQTISHPLFTTQAPTVMDTPTYGHLPPQPPQYAGNYPDEEYGEDDDPASFGPGTCRYGGKIYVSAQQIPRDDPCDFCFCFRSDIICLQQSCPPPIHGCREEPISGFCCPRYECHVKMATVMNVTTSTTTTTTTLPPHFMHHAYKGAAKRSGCQIKGQAYQVGEIISSQSGPCMSCICGGDGQMQCEPKTCSPEPMLQQMIAVAAASRRRR